MGCEVAAVVAAIVAVIAAVVAAVIAEGYCGGHCLGDGAVRRHAHDHLPATQISGRGDGERCIYIYNI
jgi:hypothetical protein